MAGWNSAALEHFEKDLCLVETQFDDMVRINESRSRDGNTTANSKELKKKRRSSASFKPKATILKRPHKPAKTNSTIRYILSKLEETKENVKEIANAQFNRAPEPAPKKVLVDITLKGATASHGQFTTIEPKPFCNLPLPNFSVMDFETFDQDMPEPEVIALTPLTTSEQKLQLPISPIPKNKPNFASPTRMRTPGSGILSPNFKSFAASPIAFGIRSPLFQQDIKSFQLLNESCQYDSEDYVSEDERFPRWAKRYLTETDLRHSTKVKYDSIFQQHNIQNVVATELSKGNSSAVEFSESSKPFAKISDFEIGKPLGAGKYGTIYLARVKRNPKVYVAIKVMFKSKLSTAHIRQILRETKHLDSLRHTNIISLYDFFHDEQRLYLVMEYANGGDLYHRLCSHKKFSEKDAACIFQQATKAIKVCHENNILHRDIKPENFVFGINNTLKLIDFGWSAPCTVNDRRETLCGTLDYLAPELVLSKPYAHSVDIWCLGVLLYELLTGSPPFEDEEILVTKLNIKYVSFTVPDYVSPEAKRLITSILKFDPYSRPTLDSLLSNPWVVSHTSE